MTCGRRIGQFDCCSVVEGDCCELAPLIPLELVSALVTDPPWGVKENVKRYKSGRGEKLIGGSYIKSRDWPDVPGDDKPFDPTTWLSYPKVVLFGANHFAELLPKSSAWIVWDKRNGRASDDNGDAELAWTNLKGPVRIHRQLWKGICREGEENVSKGVWRTHPMQKPVALMAFVLERCKLVAGDFVLDPFCGSGATLVAAKRKGIHFIGFELVNQYAESARSRVEEEALVLLAPSQPPPTARQG